MVDKLAAEVWRNTDLIRNYGDPPCTGAYEKEKDSWRWYIDFSSLEELLSFVRKSRYPVSLSYSSKDGYAMVIED